MTLGVLSTFSGIGGLELGLGRTGGFHAVGFCEIDPYCRRVLAKHWPGVPIHHDIREFDGAECDLLCGGPPCQRTSVAAAIQGKRTGETLWPEQRRLVSRWRPEWVLIEQPPGNRAWEAQVTDDLARIGYHASRLQHRLATIARLIDAGECSLLPTPCASDAKRWPGSPDHPRLQRSRGLRLQEELGARPAPEIVEWMMGFPPGWTDCGPSETQSSRRTAKKLAEPS